MPNRYKAVLLDKIVFNCEVSLDIMFIDKDMILHAFCKHTHTSREASIQSAHPAVPWEAFLQKWVDTYLGIPYVIFLDQKNL